MLFVASLVVVVRHCAENSLCVQTAGPQNLYKGMYDENDADPAVAAKAGVLSPVKIPTPAKVRKSAKHHKM